MQTVDFKKLATTYGWNTQELRYGLSVFAKIVSETTGKIWLAGGAIRRTITETPIVGASDFDFFFEKEAGYEAASQLMELRNAKLIRESDLNKTYELEFNPKPDELSETNEQFPKLIIQLIKASYYPSVEVLLDSFDFTLCQFAIEVGKPDVLYGGDTALYDVARKRIVIHRIEFPVASLRRLIKYTKQGFYACTGCLTQFLTTVADQPDLITNSPKYLD